ncbi:MAG: 50S ribosomal protein L9 [Candidatus Omnitrophica bacterium]|nr:50S ribosomal protein L9 [Candidatus Omnitrophota bacterium]
MDVVLLQDVDKLGAEGTVMHVKPGYARNYLLPRGLAVAATPQQLKLVEATARRRQQRAEQLKAEAEALKQKLEGRSLTLKLNVGADDKPFGSITTHDLAEALKQDQVAIEKHAIQLEQPIKTLGVFDVPVKLHTHVTATLKVWVVKA